MYIDSVSAKQAVRLCGFESVSMLDYLQRSGIFIPKKKNKKRRGKGRAYEFRDLIILKAISSLLQNGASVSAIKRALVEFQREKWKTDKATLTFEDHPFKYFVVSGGDIFFLRNGEGLVDLSNKGQLAFSFIIDIDKIHTDLCFDLDQGNLKFALS